MPDMSKSYLCWGQHNNVITWLNMRCDLTNRCTKHKGPWVSFFVLVFSYLYHDCGLLFLISKKCYFTAVVSYFCKQFANQNAMYSRYGLYFRFTALPAVCKYDRINEWKESTPWGCAVFTSSMMLCGLLKLNTKPRWLNHFFKAKYLQRGQQALLFTTKPKWWIDTSMLKKKKSVFPKLS